MYLTWPAKGLSHYKSLFRHYNKINVSGYVSIVIWKCDRVIPIEHRRARRIIAKNSILLNAA